MKSRELVGRRGSSKKVVLDPLLSLKVPLTSLAFSFLFLPPSIKRKWFSNLKTFLKLRTQREEKGALGPNQWRTEDKRNYYSYVLQNILCTHTFSLLLFSICITSRQVVSSTCSWVHENWQDGGPKLRPKQLIFLLQLGSGFLFLPCFVEKWIEPVNSHSVSSSFFPYSSSTLLLRQLKTKFQPQRRRKGRRESPSWLGLLL